MPRRSGDVGEDRRSRSGRARRYGGGMVVAGSAAGALWALGMSSATAPQAHADFEDLIIQPVIDAVSQAFSAVDPGLLSSLDSGLDLSSLSNALDASLGLSSLSTHALGDVAGSAQASGTLPVVGGTEPTVDVSVNGGAETPVLVDTGSDGLVIPIEDIGFQTLGFPTSFGLGSYSGGLDYFYLTFDLPVTVDGVTADGPVDVALFEFPTTSGGVDSYFSDLLGGGFNGLTGGADQGILGIGPDSVGPGPGIITNDLPTGDNGGVLINEPGDQITFEDPTANTGAVYTLNGAPISDVFVSVDGGQLTPVTADFDSGGVNGAIPESALVGSKVAGDTSLPAGTTIAVYADDNPNSLLYAYDTGPTDTPTVVSSGDFDTGAEPFLQGPIFIDTSGSGETVFDYKGSLPS